MSLWRDELKPNGSTLAALVALAVVAVASLSRLIEPGYLAYAIPALVIGAAFALFFGKRSLALGLALLVVLTGLTLPVLFVRSEPMPNVAGFKAVGRLISSGLSAIADITPPANAEPKFTILVWIALLALGFLGASWIVVRRPVGAVISALGVVTFTGSIGEGRGRTAYAAAAVAATIAFFLAEGRDRIGRWGGRRLRIPVWFGVPTLAVASLFALAAPYVFGDTPIIELDSALRPRVVIIKPLSDIKRQLQVDPPIEVMRVQAAQPQYWRLTGLDAYNGEEWSLRAEPDRIEEGEVPPPNPPVSGGVLEQRYRLTSLLSPWVPAAYAAQTITAETTGADGEPPSIDIDRDSQTLLLRGDRSPGLTYTVTSQLPRVDVNTSGPPRAVVDETEKLFGDIARPLVSGAQTPLEIARRLEAHFRAFTYDEDVIAGHTVARLQQFLAEQRGYCEQFAATMTLMLRGLGVNARVGVGFLPGAGSNGEYIVSTKDAHAWVEAELPGAGWISFDPTPGRGSASTLPEGVEESPPTTQPVPQQTSVPQPTPQIEEVPDATPPSVPERALGFVPWVALAVVVIGFVPGCKLVRRRRRRHGAPGPAVLGAFAELVDRARDLGWKTTPSETEREFVSRLGDASDGSHRVAQLAAQALYGPGAMTAEDARAAWAALVVATNAIRTHASKGRRLAAVFDPRTLLGDRPLRRARSGVAAALGRA